MRNYTSYAPITGVLPTAQSARDAGRQLSFATGNLKSAIEALETAQDNNPRVRPALHAAKRAVRELDTALLEVDILTGRLR